METHEIIKELVRRYWDNEDSYSREEIDKLEYELLKHELLTNISRLKNRVEL